MQKITMALTAGLLLTAGAAQAEDSHSAGLDGFVAVSVGQGELREFQGNNTIRNEGVSSEAQLSLAYTDSSGFGGQFDYVAFDQRMGQSNANIRSSEQLAHLFYRNDQGLLGLFTQHRRSRYEGALIGTTDFVGAEAELYLGRATVAAKGGEATWDYWGRREHGYFAGTQLRYFPDDNLRLELTADYQNDQARQRWQQKTYGAGVEHRLSDSRWSVSARYEFVREEWGPIAEQNRVLLGVKYHFGKDTLLQQDRSGASLRPVARVLYWGGGVT